MHRNDFILLLFALLLVAFSLAVSIWAPRRSPGFPGSRLRVFALICAVLVVAMLTAVELFGESHEGATHAGQAVPSPSGDAAAGEGVYAEAGCGSCHVLAAAGSTGAVGPSLDDLKPSPEQVVEQVTNGGGAMPAFKDSLSEQQIRDVAAFVTEATTGPRGSV